MTPFATEFGKGEILMFFSGESGESILFEFGKGGPKGGPGESQFLFKIISKNEKNRI